MTGNQIEKKINHLRKEIMYVSRVFPNSERLCYLKSEYRYYKNISKKH